MQGNKFSIFQCKTFNNPFSKSNTNCCDLLQKAKYINLSYLGIKCCPSNSELLDHSEISQSLPPVKPVTKSSRTESGASQAGGCLKWRIFHHYRRQTLGFSPLTLYQQEESIGVLLEDFQGHIHHLRE